MEYRVFCYLNIKQTKQWVRKHNRFRQPRPNSVVFSVCAKVLFLKSRALAVHFLASSSTDVFSLTALSCSLLHAYASFQSHSSCLNGCEAVLEYQRNPLLSHARFSRCCERLRRHHNCKSSTCQLRQVISPTEPASPIRIIMAKWNVLLLVTPKRQGRDGGVAGEKRIKRVMIKKKK